MGKATTELLCLLDCNPRANYWILVLDPKVRSVVAAVGTWLSRIQSGSHLIILSQAKGTGLLIQCLDVVDHVDVSAKVPVKAAQYSQHVEMTAAGKRCP
jgi:hypothetical protein